MAALHEPSSSSEQASLSARIRELPVASEEGKALVDALLASAGEEASALEAALENPATRQMLEGIAEASPFVWSLASEDIARLIGLLRESPELRFSELIEQTADRVRKAADEAEAMRLLRRMKREAALLIALADIGGVWGVDKVTEAMTEVADTAVSSATDFLLACRHAAGQLRDAKKSGFTLLAM